MLRVFKKNVCSSVFVEIKGKFSLVCTIFQVILHNMSNVQMCVPGQESKGPWQTLPFQGSS